MPKHHQLAVGPMEVAKGTQRTQPCDSRPKCTQVGDPDEMSAELFDEALTRAAITTGEVAFLLNISESLVRRMRSKNARERVSFAQMLRLPPSFHLAMHREMNKRFGFGRAALMDLLDAAGRLALAVGE